MEQKRPLSLVELERFIAETRSSILPERVAALIRERDVALGEGSHLQPILLPLINDLRARLTDQGITDLARVTTLKGVSGKNPQNAGEFGEPPEPSRPHPPARPNLP